MEFLPFPMFNVQCVIYMVRYDHLKLYSQCPAQYNFICHCPFFENKDMKKDKKKMPRKCAMINCSNSGKGLSFFSFPKERKGNILACSCTNGPRLPEAATGRESCAGARVKSHMAYSSCALDIL